jgi:hypothetical protein
MDKWANPSSDPVGDVRDTLEQMKTQPAGPSTCPWCGLREKVYVRTGGELVCADCNKESQAIEATWLDGLPKEGEE